MSFSRARGFSLVEVLVALFLLQLALLALAPLFIYATQSTATAASIGDVSALAEQRMELLRQVSWGSLTAGGSLTSNTTGFFDDSDPVGVVRWQITDDATPPVIRTIQVRAIANTAVVGLPKEITLTGLRAE